MFISFFPTILLNNVVVKAEAIAQFFRFVGMYKSFNSPQAFSRASPKCKVPDEIKSLVSTLNCKG